MNFVLFSITEGSFVFTDRERSLKCIAADRCGILYVPLPDSEVQYLFTSETKTTMVYADPDSHANGQKVLFEKNPTA